MQRPNWAPREVDLKPSVDLRQFLGLCPGIPVIGKVHGAQGVAVV
jgi:hypothetical protein